MQTILIHNVCFSSGNNRVNTSSSDLVVQARVQQMMCDVRTAVILAMSDG
jgi:hypothetical protein